MRRYMLNYGAACAAVLAMGAMGFTACDSDDGNGDPTSQPDATVSPDTTTSTGEPDTTGSPDIIEDTDTTPADPCDPNPCTTPPPAECVDMDTLRTYAAEGTCADNQGVAQCTYDETDTACDGEDICANGLCQAAPTEFDPATSATYISEMRVSEDENGNKLGTILGLLDVAELDFDVDASIADAIEGGSLVVLFDYPNLSDGANDQADLEVRGFIGDRGETSHDDAIAGTGSFTVTPESFVEETFIPQIQMGGSIASGVFQAGPANFSLTIPIPDIGTLTLSLVRTELESAVSVGANGEGLAHADGVLSGLLPLAELVGIFNGLVEDCECFGLDGAAAFEVNVGASFQSLGCTSEFQAASPDCSADDGSICDGLGDNKELVCNFGPALGADVDVSEDGIRDHMSAKLEFDGVSATITGVTEVEAE